MRFGIALMFTLGCSVVNEDHCANLDGDETCRVRGEARPYCSACTAEHDGCVDTPVADPECTVAYDIERVGDAVDVTLTVDNLPPSTRTAKDMVKGATLILETLKSVAETGRPKPSTRLMYAVFARIGSMLPKRTRSEHWPLPPAGA